MSDPKKLWLKLMSADQMPCQRSISWRLTGIIVLLVVCIAGIAGCATTPDDFNLHYAKQLPSYEEVEVADPLPIERKDLPAGTCLPSKTDCKYIGFTDAEFTELEKFVEAALANTDIAEQLAIALRTQHLEHGILVDTASRIESLYALQAALLDADRRAARVTAWQYRAVLLALVLGAGFAAL